MMAKLFLIILLGLFGVLLITTTQAPAWLAAPVSGGWFTQGMLLFLVSNLLAVVLATIYLWVRRDTP